MPALSLKLNEADTTALLTPILEQQYGMKIKKVTFEVRTHCEDRSNYSYPVFDNITVEFGEKINQAPRKG